MLAAVMHGSTVEIAGRLAADDNVTIWINDTVQIPSSPATLTGWTAFELTPALRSALNPGLNSLRFRVTNGVFAGTNPSGLRYEFLHAAAVPLSP